MKYKYLFLSLGFLLLLGISGCTDARKELTGDYDYYLYFSNTMDKFVTSGRFVGIGKKDQVILKTEGLELGTFVQHDQKVFLSDRTHDFVYTPHSGKIEKEKRQTKEHTGIDSVILDGKLVTLFNHGYPDTDDILYQNNLYFNNDYTIINGHIFSTGNDEQSLYILRDEEIGKLFVDRLYLSEDTLISENLGSFPNIEGSEYLIGYRLNVHENHLYGVAFDFANNRRAGLFSYSLKDSSYTFKETDREIILEDIGFSFSKGSFIYKDQLVYFSSNGTIYFIDLETAETTKKLPTNMDLSGVFIVSVIDDEHVAIATHDHDNNLIIWELDLSSLSLTEKRCVEPSLWRKQEYLYDFQVKR